MAAPYNLPSTLSSIYTLTSPLLCKFITFSLNPSPPTPMQTPVNLAQVYTCAPPPDRQTHTPHPFSPLSFCSELEVKEEKGGRGAEREGEGGGPGERGAGRLVGGSGAAPPVIIRVTAARPDCVLPAPGEMFCPGRGASICLSLPVDSNLLPACPTQPN